MAGSLRGRFQLPPTAEWLPQFCQPVTVYSAMLLAEIVVVIGDSGMWNQGFGTKAVRLALGECFLRLRYETLVAKIMPGNDGSHHVFQKVGFERQAIAGKTAVYRLKLDQYLKLAA